MKKRNLLVLAGALLIGSGALVGCGEKKEPTSEVKKENVSLKVWTSTQSTGFLKQAVNNFIKENGDIANWDIKIEAVEEDKVQEKITKDKDQAADVFHFPGDQIVKLQSQNLLYSLPESAVSGFGLSEGVVKAGQVDGKQYGVPYTPNTYFLYYDPTVYTEDDVKSLDKMLAVDVTTKGYAAGSYNIAVDFGGGWYGQSIFFSSGATMDNSGKAAGFEDAAALRKASDFLFDMAVTKNTKVASVGDTAGMFGSKAAAFVSGTWSASGLTKAYKCAALPSITLGGVETPWKAVGDYKMIGVKSTTKYPKYAAKLVAYLSGADAQTLRFSMNNTAPTNEKAIEENQFAFEGNEAIAGQTATLANTFAQPSVAYASNNYWSAYEAFYQTLKTATSADDAFTKTQAFNDTLKNYKAAE